MIPCLRCDGLYQPPRRSFSHFCEPCRAQRNREQTATRAREARAAATAVREQIGNLVAHGVERSYVDPHLDDLDTIMGSPRLIRTVLPRDATVQDRMPVGAVAPAGPTEGTSTYFTDFREQLEKHAESVAEHPWFAANPHWSYGVNGDGDSDMVERVLSWSEDHSTTANLSAA